MNHSLTRSLICHPTCPGAAVNGISVSVGLAANGTLSLCYRVIGNSAQIKLPAARDAGPADNLWQHTCCELFIAGDDGEPYREFNFSPAGQWAIYQFDAYRQRDNNFQPLAAPKITLTQHADGFELAVTLPPELIPAGDTLHLGITSVIEAGDGSKSYWALAHCAAQPDFHPRQSFTLALTKNTP